MDMESAEHERILFTIFFAKYIAEKDLIEIHLNRNFPPKQELQNVYQHTYRGSLNLNGTFLKYNERLQQMVYSGEPRFKQQGRQRLA